MTGPRQGLSLIEVLIAVAILAVGILGALAIQSTSLQTTNRMSATQSVTQIAFRELEFQRSAFVGLRPADPDCLSEGGIAARFSCTVEVIDCLVVDGQASCPPAVAGSANSFLVRVTASDESGSSVTLQRLLGERVFVDEE